VRGAIVASMSSAFVYDDRAGFRATWYGRVPLADFK
jgi:hypothetical protein